MKMEAPVSVVGVGEELVGFRLAGVSETIDLKKKDTDEVYERLSEGDRMLIITKKAAEKLGAKTDRLRERNIVLVLPEAGEEGANIQKLIKETVGFDLKR